MRERFFLKAYEMSYEKKIDLKEKICKLVCSKLRVRENERKEISFKVLAKVNNKRGSVKILNHIDHFVFVFFNIFLSLFSLYINVL